MAYQKPRIVIEESPLARFFGDLPNTLLAFMQLNQQMEQMQINRDYASAREDLKFARQDYLQTKAREDAWRDTLAKAGYSTKHITGPGAALIESNTQDITSTTDASEQTILELQSLSADLAKWAQKGIDWQKEFSAFEDEDKENEWRNLLLEGGLSIGDEGQVVGTGEFAEVLKGLSDTELEKLKDENYRLAVTRGLKDEAGAIKEWGTLMTGQKTASEIGQKRSSVMWQNIINTSERYSGRGAIAATQGELIKYDEYQDASGNLTLEGQQLDLQKAAIGREYEYLVMGAYTDVPEGATEEQQIQLHRRWLSNYNIMAADFDVAKPTAGGYGRQGAPGNQIRLRETIGAAYKNFQNIVAGGDKNEITAFSSTALKYLGVNFNDPAIVEELDLQSILDRDVINDEILASLEYTKRLEAGTLGPVGMSIGPELGPPLPEGGLPTPVPTIEEDISYYQHNKDYLDKATEAVWGPEVTEVIQAIPLYQGAKKAISATGAAYQTSADVINQTLFNIGATGYNVAGVPLNQAIKAMTGYSPGFSGERQMDLLLGGTGATPATDPDYSFGTYTPAGGFWTKEMSTALDQLSSTDKQISKPFEYTSIQARREAVTDPVVADSLAAIDTVAAVSDSADAAPQELQLINVLLSSEHIKSLGISYIDIIKEWKAEGSPDIGDWLIDMFPEIEANLIR